MKVESDFLVVALGMRDGLMVQEPRQEVAKKALEEACWSVAKCQIPVVTKLLN